MGKHQHEGHIPADDIAQRREDERRHAEDTSKKLQQLKRNSRRYLNMDRPLHDLERISQLFADWSDRVADDWGVFENSGPEEIAVSKEMIRRFDYALSHLQHLISELREIHSANEPV